jgi:glycosidase
LENSIKIAVKMVDLFKQIGKLVEKEEMRFFVLILLLVSATATLARASIEQCIVNAFRSAGPSVPKSQTMSYTNKDQLQPGQSTLYNPEAGKQVIYEAQVRSANRALNSSKPGTLEDMMKPGQDFEKGITLDYIKNKVHATTAWLMPIFPNNAKWSIPHPLDTEGSPYAVRDYMHVSGLISEKAIEAGRSENSYEESKLPPQWGDDSFAQFMKQAKAKKLNIMLDIAFNHFGHNYQFYDYAKQTPIRDRVAAGQNLDNLWNFSKTFEPDLLHPHILDTVDKINKLAASDPKVATDLDAFKQRAPNLKNDDLVRGFNMWRAMTDSERARYNPDNPNYLENQVPGFYRGTRVQPSIGVGDNFTNNWKDVKFLYHHDIRGSDLQRGDYYENFVRNREYLFRALNFWVAKGVHGFRLDHASDDDSGLSANEWKYIIEKVNYYDWIRQGKPKDYKPPIYLTEDFDHPEQSAKIADTMTEGFGNDIRGRYVPGSIKDASFFQAQIEKRQRLQGKTLAVTGHQNHDEERGISADFAGFDIWSEAAIHAIESIGPGTPMMLMGQEFGEPNQLNFKQADFLRSRFPSEPEHNDQGQALVDFYGMINKARTDPANRALLSPNHYYLNLTQGGSDPQVLAMVNWDYSKGTNVMFSFIRPWIAGDPKSYHYAIPDELAHQLQLKSDLKYKLVNVFNNQDSGCKWGGDLKGDLEIHMNGVDRVQWLRLEVCP